MKKMVTAAVALLAMVSVFAEEFIAKDMLGNAQAFETWEKHEKAQFKEGSGPEGKSAVTISSLHGGPFMISKSLNEEALEKMKGRKVVLYGMIKAENVKKGAQHWMGIKFQIVYRKKGDKKGYFIEKSANYGTFDWKEFEIGGKLPDDLSSFTIKIGLQGTSGKIQVSDVDLKLEE